MDKQARRLHIFIRDVPPLDSLPGPGCFAKKCEAGFHAGIVEETADRDTASHFSPSISFDKFCNDCLQRNPVQGIAGMGEAHERITSGIWVMTTEYDYDIWLGILHE